LNKLKHSFAINFEKASEIRWGKNAGEVTMSEIDAILKQGLTPPTEA